MTRLKAFVYATSERAVKTFCQTTAAVIVADQVTTLINLDWAGYAGVGGLAALLSVLTSVGSGGFGNVGPSLAGEKLAADQ